MLRFPCYLSSRRIIQICVFVCLLSRASAWKSLFDKFINGCIKRQASLQLPVLRWVSPLLGQASAEKHKHLTGDRWAQRGTLKSYWDHLDGAEISAFACVNATWGLPVMTSEGGSREEKNHSKSSVLCVTTYSSTATEFHLDLDFSGMELKWLFNQQKMKRQRLIIC